MDFFVYTLLGAGLLAGTDVQLPPEERSAAVPVTVIITDLPSTTSAIKLNFYNSAEAFLKSGQAALRRIVVPKGHNKVEVQVSLAPGEWAVALSQDTNDNGRLDRNFLGIPTEPYAFSNNIRPHLSAPKFEECKFMADGGRKVITIQLKK